MKKAYSNFYDKDAKSKKDKEKYYRKTRQRSYQMNQKRIKIHGFNDKTDRINEGKAHIGINRLSKIQRRVVRGSASRISYHVHQKVEENEQDNAGIEAMHKSEEAAERGVKIAHHASYANKLKQSRNPENVQDKAEKVKNNSTKGKDTELNVISNPISKWQQKNQIKKEYLKSKKANRRVTDTVHSFSQSAKEKAIAMSKQTMQFISKHSHGIWFGIISVMMILVLSGTLSSCTLMFQGSSNLVLSSSYTATDEAIIDANDDYKAMEKNLKDKISQIEKEYPGYDEYRYDIDEINHNPYELTSYLTVLFEDYSREEVQDTLHEMFAKQYQFSVEEKIEIKDTDNKKKKEKIRILQVKLKNNGLRYVIVNSDLTKQQMERYQLLLETKGNRSYLFEDDIYANSSGEYTDYDIPGEALTDEKFANMIHEAEKYLGYPYVWGGSTPETSFDCSGFVSWVINNSNNGWNVGRQTANGLMDYCKIIPPSEAKPGDLIFFQGTYETPGASHVGIYVGNGMMIHCGNPISYESINISYWQEHFYCYGRL